MHIFGTCLSTNYAIAIKVHQIISLWWLCYWKNKDSLSTYFSMRMMCLFFEAGHLYNLPLTSLNNIVRPSLFSSTCLFNTQPCQSCLHACKAFTITINFYPPILHRDVCTNVRERMNNEWTKLSLEAASPLTKSIINYSDAQWDAIFLEHDCTLNIYRDTFCKRQLPFEQEFWETLYSSNRSLF